MKQAGDSGYVLFPFAKRGVASPVDTQEFRAIVSECRSPKLTDRAEAMSARFYDLWHAKNESMSARGGHLGEPGGAILIHPDKGILFPRGASAEQFYAVEDIAQVLHKASRHPGAVKEQFILPAREMNAARPVLPGRTDMAADLGKAFRMSASGAKAASRAAERVSGPILVDAHENDFAGRTPSVAPVPSASQPMTWDRFVAALPRVDLGNAFAGVSVPAMASGDIVDFVAAKRQITEPAVSPVAPAAPVVRYSDLRMAA